jgi:cytochrome b561
MDTPKRYHPALVTLHWLVALFVFIDLYLGYFYIRPLLMTRGGGVRATDPMLKIHMAVGVAILVLLVIRFVIRIVLKKPAPADAGNAFLNILARVVHYALYFFVFAITIVGLVLALQTNRFQVAFLGATSGPGLGPGGGFPAPGFGTPRAFPTPGPGTPEAPFFPGGSGAPGFGNRGNPGFRGGSASFRLAFFLLPLHLGISIILIALLVLHILAAFYHQFIRRDHLLGRMWYG